MVDVNLIAKTAKEVKSVNIIERDTIVKSVEEKASVLTRDRELSVKIVEGRRSVHTEDRSQDVKNASEPLLYLFITWSSYENSHPQLYRNINHANPPTTIVIIARLISCFVVSGLAGDGLVNGVSFFTSSAFLTLTLLFTTEV